MSSAELKSALDAGALAVEAEIPVEKAVPKNREDVGPAEEADAAAAEAAKPVDKTVPISREKIATDDDGADKPKGRLLPWEPDAPTEGSDASDKELSDN